MRGIALSSLLSCRLLANLNSHGSPVAPTWGPPVLNRKQKRPRVNSLVWDRAAAFCAAGPPEVLSRMSRLVTQAAERERELARARSQRLKQAAPSLPGESVSRGFADRGALEGYPSHYTSLVNSMFLWEHGHHFTGDIFTDWEHFVFSTNHLEIALVLRALFTDKD